VIGLLGPVSGAAAVSFSGIAAPFSGGGSSFRTAVVPAGAATGPLKVTTPAGTLQTLKPFLQQATRTGVSPVSPSSRSSPAFGLIFAASDDVSH
jgi:hypothetical protein